MKSANRQDGVGQTESETRAVDAGPRTGYDGRAHTLDSFGIIGVYMLVQLTPIGKTR